MPASAHSETSDVPESELYADYVDESHMQAFAQALSAEYFVDNEYHDSPPNHGTPPTRSPGRSFSIAHSSQSPRSLRSSSIAVNGNSIGSAKRIRRISALSDFAPVNLRVRKRKKGTSKGHEKKQEWMFVLVRWPLLMFIFLFILFEFGLYVFVRQWVNAKEWLTAWRGRKGELRKHLRASRSYDEWKEAARKLDDFLGFDEWKAADEDPYYDWRLVHKVLRSLRTLRRDNDARGVLGVLETCIRTNFAGVESARLYSETFLGTKTLIESYITEVEKALIYVRETPILSEQEKRRFFKSANLNLGVTALCLSGGAGFGYYHFGVVKAFAQADLLPRVITGTSAGGLVAALACTRTDAELKRLLVPELADRITACEDPFKVWWKRFRETGARFDSVTWARKASFFTRGSLTFKEAYQRTGRILNISVIPADRHSPTKLLNYMTAPDTVIWSTLLASAAVPGILNPVVLMQKTKDGSLIPWNWGSKFKDGSLRVDIPLQSLNLYFNVTETVVSQVNPHVHLFFFAPRGSAGKPVAHRKDKGWRGNFLLSAAEQWLKLELTKNFKVIRDLDLLPQLLGQDWSSVFLQRFDGTVTLWPKTKFIDWIHILSDPDRTDLARKMRAGELATWPKLHMIENRARLEREILRGRRAVRRNQTSRSIGTLENADIDPGELPDLSMAAVMSPTAEPDETAVETDTDVPGQHGPPFVLRNQHRSGTSTPVELKTCPDPLRSPARRRRWTSLLLDDGETGRASIRAQKDYGLPHADPEPMVVSPSTSAQDSSFFRLPSSDILRSLRTKSFSRLASPFHTNKELDGTPPARSSPDTWSSDSSDDEDDLDIYDEVFEPDDGDYRQRPISNTQQISTSTLAAT